MLPSRCSALPICSCKSAVTASVSAFPVSLRSRSCHLAKSRMRIRSSAARSDVCSLDCLWVCIDERDPGRRADIVPLPSVGTELTKLLAELGLRYKPECGCHAKALAMDAWRAEGCVANRELIIAWL